jgi:RNA polymerase sigma-70 factor (ECF subfamily)
MEELGIALICQEKNMNTDEEKLILAAREDPTAFGELYRLYAEKVYRYLYSMTRDVQEAEDITTQTFMKAFERFGSFRSDGHFASWLFKIAHNKAMDHFRKRKRFLAVDETHEQGEDTNSINNVIQLEQWAVLSKMMQALSAEERELLSLRYLADLKFAEIAHLLGANQVTVKKKLYRLLERLQNQLEESDE